jgi:hypothetical protein
MSENTNSQRSGERTTTDNPWEAQSPYLQDTFYEAQRAYNNAYGMGQQERGAYQQGMDVTGQQLDRTLGNQGAMEGAWQGLRDMQQQAAAKYNGVVDQVLGTTMGNIQSQAAEFAGNNPYLQSAIDQSWGNAQKLLGQQVGGAGGINHQAASSGNMSSSRAGVAEGLATSEMADRAQQNELALRKGAYDQGIGQANQMLGNQMSMAQMLKTNPAEAAALLQGQQGADLAYQDVINQALGQQLGFSQGEQGGMIDQQQQWQNLGNYYGIVGANNWGGTTDTEYDEEGTGYGTRKGTEYGKTKDSSSDWGFSLST